MDRALASHQLIWLQQSLNAAEYLLSFFNIYLFPMIKTKNIDNSDIFNSFEKLENNKTNQNKTNIQYSNLNITKMVDKVDIF